MSTPSPLPWPAEHLEKVALCPVCGWADRTLRHQALRDETFFTAAGEWNLWQCAECQSGWLDPRPDEASIGQAYGTYYTHANSPALPSPGPYQRLKRALSNDYRFWKFGSRRAERIFGGRWIGRFVSALGQNIDLEMRYLPRPPGRDAALLDVGCGNGTFLSLAAEAGWRCFGVEPDEKAAKVAKAEGVEVRPLLRDWQSSGRTFDAMTFNHTIEHVHDPVATMKLAHSLLKPSGFLFLETPNMGAVGHDLYQRHWRGLETPRHLVLFSHVGMTAALAQSGFTSIQVRRRPSPLLPMAGMSRRQAAGLDPYSETPLPESAPTMPQPADIERERDVVAQREFLTLTARKGPAQ